MRPLGLSIVMAFALAAACERRPPRTDGPPEQRPRPIRRADSAGDAAGDAVLARVGPVPIHARDLLDAARASRGGLTLRQALDERIRMELLAQAAAGEVATTMSPTGDDLESRQQAEVERLIERELEPRLVPEAITAGEARAAYDRARKRFVHGRLVQVAVLCVFTGARMRPEPRARATENAERLRDHLAGRPGLGTEEFLGIARDPVWVGRQVSATTVWQERDEPFPRVVGDAVSRLSHPGETTPLVSDETGLYLARYLDERPAENVSFAEAEPALRAEIFAPWRRQRFLQLVLDIARDHDVAVFPEAFPTLVPGGTAHPSAD